MKFAFVVHPISVRDVARKYPIARFFPDAVIETALKFKKPIVASHVTGIQSLTGETLEGVFIGCPMTPRQMVEMDIEYVYGRIVECAELAAKEGAKIIGLGAFTSVVGDGGVTIASRSPIAVTTGNSYTVASAIQGTLKACDLLGIDKSKATLAVVGATGSIGQTCATTLSREFASTYLVGRSVERTKALEAVIPRSSATTDVNVIKGADVIVTVTSSDSAIIEPKHLQPGAVVCDVARPRDVSVRVSKERPDVLVIEGGVIRVPGENVDFGIEFGFPPSTAYACMSETMILALENRAENFTLGKSVSEAQVEEISGLAAKHGFELAGFRSFEKAVSEESIEAARKARIENQASVING